MMRKMTGKRVLVSLLLVLILAVLCACGSGNSGKEKGSLPAAAEKETTARDKEKSSDAEPLGDVNTIPEDGIITKEQFATVAGEDREISFVGETDDGIKYTWVYPAAQIQNPEDQNLKITFETENLDDIRKEANNANDALKMTMQGGGLICPPTLTVVIPQAWQSDTGLLLKEQDAKLAKMSDVTIVSQPAEKKNQGEDSKDSSAENSTEAAAGRETLTEPVEGTTTLTMTVLSLDGDSYVVGGITDPDKLAAINRQMQTVTSANANQGYTGEMGTEGSDQGVSAYSDDSGSGSGSSGNSGTGSGKSGKSSSGKSSSGKRSSGKSSSGDVANSETGDNSSGSGKSSGNGSSGSSGGTCTISINCSTILSNMDSLPAEKEEFVPSDGWILKSTKVSFSAGESVHDILQKVCKDKGIHMESSFTPAYDSAYVEGINQIYEFDCGELSGWMFSVNGWFPNYGCSKYSVSDGDVIQWVYTCDLGKDVGDNSMY